MYSKTNPGEGRLTSRQKRIFAVIGVVLVLVFGGLTAWGALSSDPGSANGCVNLTVPSSTGGATVHYCGAAARSFCATSFRSQDQLSLRARPQCVLAGLGPTTKATAAAT